LDLILILDMFSSSSSWSGWMKWGNKDEKKGEKKGGKKLSHGK
jgi:hypothetical protein